MLEKDNATKGKHKITHSYNGSDNIQTGFTIKIRITSMRLCIAVTSGEVMHVTNVSEQFPMDQTLSRASDTSVHKARSIQTFGFHMP